MSIITIGRMIGAFLLLLTKPLSVQFFIIYVLCCVSDVLDGYIARKTRTTSKLGEILDSVADFVLVAVVLVIFIPLLAWAPWMLYWVGIIVLVRFLSLAVGCVKYHAMPLLHTFANKATGIVLCCFPIMYQVFGLTITVFILCGIASLSALEELIIIICSTKLNRNITGLFEFVSIDGFGRKDE